MKRIKINQSLIMSVSLYRRTASIHNAIRTADDDVIEIIVDVDGRVGQTFLFFLCTLPFIGEKYGKTLIIRCNQRFITLLKRVGFIDTLSADMEIIPNETDLTPFLKSSAKIITTPESIFSLVTTITKEAPVEMSDELSALFISKVGEMFNNATEHSVAGHVIGAKYFRNQKYTYCFSCYDTGVGIPEKVIAAIDKGFTHKEAFMWAIKKGNSTANRIETRIPRGLGLDLLHSFAKANDGAIRICSGKVLYTYNKRDGAKYHELEIPFEGTLYEMDIIADNNYKYILK